MGVEIFVQHLARVLTEVASLSSGVQEPRSQDHHGLASGLFQLNLNGVELPIDDVDHPVDLLGRDGPHPRLLSQKIHHMCRELLAALVVLIHLLPIDGADLCQLPLVVWGAIQ